MKKKKIINYQLSIINFLVLCAVLGVLVFAPPPADAFAAERMTLYEEQSYSVELEYDEPELSVEWLWNPGNHSYSTLSAESTVTITASIIDSGETGIPVLVTFEFIPDPKFDYNGGFLVNGTEVSRETEYGIVFEYLTGEDSDITINVSLKGKFNDNEAFGEKMLIGDINATAEPVDIKENMQTPIIIEESEAPTEEYENEPNVDEDEVNGLAITDYIDEDDGLPEYNQPDTGQLPDISLEMTGIDIEAESD